MRETAKAIYKKKQISRVYESNLAGEFAARIKGRRSQTSKFLSNGKRFALKAIVTTRSSHANIN